MALKEGSSDEVVAANIDILTREGKSFPDAVTEAYRHAGKSRVEISLAAASAEGQDPVHAIPRAGQDGFRAAHDRMAIVVR